MTCRVAIDLDGTQRFSIDAAEPEEEKRRAIAATNEPVPKSRRELVYNRISEENLPSTPAFKLISHFRCIRFRGHPKY